MKNENPNRRSAHVQFAASAIWTFCALLAHGFHHPVRAAACGGVAFLFLIYGLILWNLPPGGPKPPTRGIGGRGLVIAK